MKIILPVTIINILLCLAICLAISIPNYPIYFIPLVGAFIILVINEKDFK